MSKQALHYLSDKQLSELLEVSRQTIWRWVREGSFPAPVKLGSNCTRWKMAAVKSWEAEREGAA